MNKQEIKIKFGDKICFCCGLAVSVHIYGRYVVLENRQEGYLNDGCVEKGEKRRCPMNSPPMVIHTLVHTSLENSQTPSHDHANIDYQITMEGHTYDQKEKGLHPHVPPTAIHIGFHCKTKGGSLTEAQYQAGLELIKEIARCKNIPIPLTHNHIFSHHGIETAHPSSCPGPFFPWARLMNDQSPHTLVPIYQNGAPITIGYLKMGSTYAPVQKIAKALGFTVQWDGIQNRIELKREL
jgi:hypothetical protein